MSCRCVAHCLKYAEHFSGSKDVFGFEGDNGPRPDLPSGSIPVTALASPAPAADIVDFVWLADCTGTSIAYADNDFQ